jgi:uncharacterized sulfatase
MGCYGGTVVPTPNIDRLASEGVRFEQCFTNSAVCTPSRGCLMTGMYPHRHGAFHNNIALRPEATTLAEVLRRPSARAAGGHSGAYDTAWIGKWHLDDPKNLGRPSWIPPERGRGFADTRWMFNSSHTKGVIEKPDGSVELSPDPAAGRYMSDWLADKAIEFIGRERSAPFFLTVGFPDPHEPYAVREPYASRFRPADMELPATFTRSDGEPSWAEEGLEGCGSARNKPDAAATHRAAMAAYCGSVACIDENVGRIVDALRDAGTLDDTLIVFTSDHGDYMGEHGLVGKNRCFETAYRIPLILRGPGAGPAGAARSEFVTTVDVQPTLLGLMGVEPSGLEDGSDLSALVRGEDGAAGDAPDAAFFHQSHFAFAGVFTGRWELALWETGEHALFDRVNDPQQTRNLYGDPARRDVVRELAQRIAEHNLAVGSPAYFVWLEDEVARITGRA